MYKYFDNCFYKKKYIFSFFLCLVDIIKNFKFMGKNMLILNDICFVGIYIEGMFSIF